MSLTSFQTHLPTLKRVTASCGYCLALLLTRATEARLAIMPCQVKLAGKPSLTCQHDTLLQDQSTKLLHMLLSGSQSAVCFDTQGKHPASFFVFCPLHASRDFLSDQEHAASAKRSCIFTCDLDFYVHATSSSSSSQVMRQNVECFQTASLFNLTGYKVLFMSCGCCFCLSSFLRTC